MLYYIRSKIQLLKGRKILSGRFDQNFCRMKLKSNLQMRNLCFMNNKIESERDGMKKGINIKNNTLG